MDHVVMYSGGIGSFFAAKRVREQYPDDKLILLFMDTEMEDKDLYRFLDDSVKFIPDAKLVRLDQGMNIWGAMKKVRFLGNSLVDPCSKLLKRVPSYDWVKENYPKRKSVTLYVGIDWTEEHRMKSILHRWWPYTVVAPLCKKPYLSKPNLLKECKIIGLKPPRLYRMGFSHNNCGGFCVKAGQKQFALLLEKFPKRYAFHERKEQEMREFLGKDVAMLSMMRKGVRRYVTMKEYREMIQKKEIEVPAIDDGVACNCFLG